MEGLVAAQSGGLVCAGIKESKKAMRLEICKMSLFYYETKLHTTKALKVTHFKHICLVV